jgi:acyl carrier protein
MTRLEEMLAEILMCEADALPPAATPLNDIEGWDSLRHVMLVVGLEQRFAVSLSAEDIRLMVTVGDVNRILRDKGASV